MKFNDWYKEFLEEDKTGLSDRELLFIAFTAGETKTDEVGQVEAGVMPICGYCKDCKHWNAENVECENDIIWLNRPKGVFFNISDLKTQDWFGCVRFESKDFDNRI